LILALKLAQHFAMNLLKIHLIHENSIFAPQQMKISRNSFLFPLLPIFVMFLGQHNSKIGFIFCCCCFYWDFRTRDSCNLQLFCCSFFMILLQLIHKHDCWSNFLLKFIGSCLGAKFSFIVQFFFFLILFGFQFLCTRSSSFHVGLPISILCMIFALVNEKKPFGEKIVWYLFYKY
jgi:hypothetical protein